MDAKAVVHATAIDSDSNHLASAARLVSVSSFFELATHDRARSAGSLVRGRASGKRSIDSAAMGGEQKPVHHRLGRGGKKPIVIIGTVVVFFVVLSMTGLGHSHNHVERDMPAHAALSGRGARRHRPEADHFARAVSPSPKFADLHYFRHRMVLELVMDIS